MNNPYLEWHRELDESNMLGLIDAVPANLKEAWRLGTEFAPQVPRADYRQIVVCGMGGSAIGGDLLRSFLGDRLQAPIISVRKYEVPPALLRDSLVVVSSYSGNTGETLSAMASVGEGAQIIAVTSGGKLAAICRDRNLPHCLIPGGQPPRSALAYSFVPTLIALRAAGVADFADDEFHDAVTAVEAACADYGIYSPGNPAMKLAEVLHGTIPFVYASPALLEGVARRWACQFNENAKSLAHYAYWTELNHNEIVGWEANPELMKQVSVVAMNDVDDDPIARQQAAIALGIIEPLANDAMRIDSGSGGRLARMLRMVMLGDYASVYLAYRNGVDPTTISKIDYLKSQLAK